MLEKFPTQKRCVIAAAIVAGGTGICAEVVDAPLRSELDQTDVSSDAQNGLATQVGNTSFIMDYPTLEREWTQESEQEFLSLVKKSATSELLEADRDRLVSLRKFRRGSRSKRSYSELCADRDAKKRFDNLVEALDLYIECKIKSPSLEKG